MTSLRSIAQSATGKQPLTLLELNNTAIVFQADVIMSENHSKSASITGYPVEKNSDIAEHAMPTDFSISCSGLVSDASMSYFDLTEAIAGSTLGALFDGTSKSQKAYELLDNWYESSTPLQVRGHFAKDGFKDLSGELRPFFIQNLNITRDRNTGAALRYSMTLKSVRIVTIGQATLTTLAFAIDKGSQLLKSNTKSNAVDSQATWTSLRDDKELAIQISNGNLAAN